jgi:LPXTG-motif cell wall-anchored protein
VSGEHTAAPAETKWQPQIATEVPTRVLASDATAVADKVKADAVGGSQWPVKEWADATQTKPKTHFPFVAAGEVVKATVPPAASAALPVGAVIVSKEPTKVTLPGPGEWVEATTDLPDTGSGHYAMRWCLRAEDQGGNAKYLPEGGPFCDDYFSMSERFTIPMTLAVASELPNQFGPRGEAPDDTITVSLPDSKDSWIATRGGKAAVVKVTGVFYAGSASSFIIADKPPVDAKTLGAASVNVTLPTSGRDPVTVAAPAGFTVPTSQYGTWVWQIKRADQTPQVAELFDNDPADKFGQQMETHVTQMELTIQSHVVEASVAEPTGDATVEVCDNVWVEHANPADLWLNQWGTDKPVEVKVDGELHQSAVPAAQTLSVDPSVPVVDEYRLTFTAAGKEHAQRVCHTVKHGEYGAYGFVFGIELAKQPEATRDYLARGAATPLWLPAETTMVKRTPVIHTAATRWSATNNGKETIFFTDEIWQIDWPEAPADTNMIGAVGHGEWPGYGPWEADAKTITSELWRIEVKITPESCSADNQAAKLIAVNQATPALNTWGASQKVSGSRFKAEGGDATYTFVTTYPGDARTEAYKSVCGEKSETITLNHRAPEFITEFVAPSDVKHATIERAGERDKAIEVEAGAELVDVLHVWNPDADEPQPDMTGWAATWDSYFLPLAADAEPLNVVDGEAGKVYDGAVCTPETMLVTAGDPVQIEKAGNYLSPAITTPGEPGMVFMVETVTDNQGQVIRRGACGAVSESAIVLPPPDQPKPKITTNAPQHANVGEKIKDEAILAGPFPEGTQIEFWYQHTDYTNPGAARDELKCDAPDPDKTEGAVKIGVTVLDHQVAEGVTEKVYSPEFTSAKGGCTWIKETAYTTDGEGTTVLAEGRFGAANERTMWHQAAPPPPPGELPNTGTNIGIWSALTGASLLTGAALIGVAYWRRRQIN